MRFAGPECPTFDRGSRLLYSARSQTSWLDLGKSPEEKTEKGIGKVKKEKKGKERGGQEGMKHAARARGLDW